MEWTRTLAWILRGSPWGFALTVASFTAIYVLVPMEAEPHRATQVVAESDGGLK